MEAKSEYLTSRLTSIAGYLLKCSPAQTQVLEIPNTKENLTSEVSGFGEGNTNYDPLKDNPSNKYPSMTRELRVRNPSFSVLSC